MARPAPVETDDSAIPAAMRRFFQNRASELMGVGLLGLPFAFSKAGFIGGVFAVTSFGIICWRTSILIGRELNGDPRPQSFFEDSPWKTPLPPGSAPGARMRKPIRSFPDIAVSVGKCIAYYVPSYQCVLYITRRGVED